MEVEAVYHKGILTLKDALPLEEGQTVWVIVQPEDAERLNAVRQAVKNWKAQHPSVAPVEPPEFSPEEWAKLDAEFDELLAELHVTSGQYTEEEIAEDVDQALRAVRAMQRNQNR